jgi:hypothetical protein
MTEWLTGLSGTDTCGLETVGVVVAKCLSLEMVVELQQSCSTIPCSRRLMVEDLILPRAKIDLRQAQA